MVHDTGDVDELLGARQLSVRELYALWEQRQPVPDAGARKAATVATSAARQVPWVQGGVALARRYAEQALAREEFLLVCDAAREALRYWGGRGDADAAELARLRITYAAALTRLGFTGEARAALEACVGHGASATALGPRLRSDCFLGLGEVLREESQRATSRAVRFQTAQQALEFYERSLALEPDRADALAVAAAASLVLGPPGSTLRDEAREKARHLLRLTERPPADGAGSHAHTARARARATAHAVLGDVDAAAESYRAMAAIEGTATQDLADARFYSQFLAEALGRPRDFFRPAFPPLQLIVFAGHIPDLPGDSPRFPAAMIEAVRQRIAKRLAEVGARVGLVSAAAGGDLLFNEAMRDRGGTVHVMLPWSRDEFRQFSVRRFEPAGGPAVWEPLFDRALAEAATVREIGQANVPSSDVGWAYPAEVMAGVALHTARVSRLDVLPMALWDGKPGYGAGGTAAFVEFWRQQLRREVDVIGLPPLPVEASGPPRHAPQSRRCERATMRQEVKSMLFADIVGYSKLSEHVIPDFVESFLERVSQLAASSAHPPRFVNTWGDAIYAVFDFARDAGSFALELIRLIHDGREEWLRKGLYWEERVTDAADGSTTRVERHPLNVRIGLHTGPVYVHHDPVVRQLGFTGAHVSRAARIEPVAKPGEVFASEQFAALAELGDEIRRCAAGPDAVVLPNGFVCEYAGTMQLAKAYPGRYRIYRVVPFRAFELDELARAAHEDFCAKARARGETAATAPALRPWDELPDDLREANYAQVADVPNKLRRLGYELAPTYGTPPSEIVISPEQLEDLAIREHERWMNDRLHQGWTYAPQRDNARKHHPSLVPWDALSESEREKDRDAVRNVPRFVERAGFRVRKVEGGG